MFTALHFKERMNQNPFKPFRIHMSDGKVYDITNHDVAMVKRHALEVGIDPDHDSIAGRFVDCALLHITRVEELTAATA
ncbi:MAG TPA: hypothetical protein VFC44_23675 [Candidatus Saccharimonadales bacterium]|nr:hypothetical protein [Candidatus Saccharimonadales bacterium]